MSAPVFPFERVTPRLRLREFEPSDAAAVQRFAGDPGVVEHLPFGPNTRADTEAFLGRVAEAARTIPRRSYEVAVTERASGELIGGVRLGATSDAFRDASLGYILRRDLWGRGIITEGASAIVEFGFAHLQLHRIWATCAVGNVGSRRVLEKLGMTREAHLREDRQVRGQWRDSYLYGTLDREWPGRAAQRRERTLVVVSGPIGSGKNAVSTALAGILEREGRRVAVIDLDDLWFMLDHQVPRTHELDNWLEARRSAALLTDEFYRSGRDTVVVNGPFFTAEERDAYLAHVTTPVAPFFVTLRVSLGEAWRRAQGDPRRVASKDREWLAARHAASDALTRSLVATDLVLPTEGRTPAEIASDVLVQLRSARAIGGAIDPR